MTTEIKHNISATLERSVCRKGEAQFLFYCRAYTAGKKESLYLVPIVLKYRTLNSKKVLTMLNDCIIYNIFKVDEIQSNSTSYPSI